MKSFEPIALEILQSILEDEDHDDIVKDVAFGSEDGYWTQIGGDFGDPWLYGGDWFNPVKGEVLHFDGVENEKEVEPDEVEIPASMLAKLPPEDEDWRENTERDRIIGNYKYARAAFLNARTERTFWLFDVEDGIPAWLQRYEEPVRKQFDEEAGFEHWPVEQKMIEIGHYAGFREFAHSIYMNKIEAEKFLRTTL